MTARTVDHLMAGATRVAGFISRETKVTTEGCTRCDPEKICLEPTVTKIDDAGHYVADGATEAQAIAHIALFFRWCDERGLLSDEHTADSELARELRKARKKESYGDYLWDNFSGKLVGDDLCDRARSFAEQRYEQFVRELGSVTGKELLTFSEQDVDFASVAQMLDRLLEAHSQSPAKPWWKFW
jgi:hypothetical protein